MPVPVAGVAMPWLQWWERLDSRQGARSDSVRLANIRAILYSKGS
jgi:hypothetical protein